MLPMALNLCPGLAHSEQEKLYRAKPSQIYMNSLNECLTKIILMPISPLQRLRIRDLLAVVVLTASQGFGIFFGGVEKIETKQS